MNNPTHQEIWGEQLQQDTQQNPIKEEDMMQFQVDSLVLLINKTDSGATSTSLQEGDTGKVISRYSGGFLGRPLVYYDVLFFTKNGSRRQNSIPWYCLKEVKKVKDAMLEKLEARVKEYEDQLVDARERVRTYKEIKKWL
jgi:hypothetical protein